MAYQSGRVPQKNSNYTNGNDSALIIALMLLLKNERCDPLVIFALIYILT